MLIVKVQDGENIDKALKRFKRKFNNVGVIKELRERQQFTKKSTKRRQEVIKAKYVQKLKNNEAL
jgi:small subunit ribosomal protein S21